MSEIVNLQNVLLLLVKMIVPTIEETNSKKTTVSSVVNAFETGKKYKIKITLTEIV